MKTLKILPLLFIFALTTFQSKAEPGSVEKITKAYLSLKNSLVTDNAKGAQESAKVLLSALSDQPDKGLKPEQRKLLASYAEKLKFDSRHISETTVIDHQREHFASLSKNMYTVLKGLQINATTLYEQYCPMKKAYWLSESSTIKNPYYGKTMVECGETKATLKPAGK